MHVIIECAYTRRDLSIGEFLDEDRKGMETMWRILQEREKKEEYKGHRTMNILTQRKPKNSQRKKVAIKLDMPESSSEFRIYSL